MAYGFSPAFTVTYKPYGSATPQTITLAAVTYSHYREKYKQRHSAPLDTQLKDTYAFQTIDSLGAGLLSVNPFDLGGASTTTHRRYKRFLDSCFRMLREKRIPNLIVDIRKNGGGDDPNDLLTFSYLARHSFRENKNAFTLFQEVPFKPYYFTDDPSETKDLEESVREEHNQLSPYWSS